MDLLKAKVSFPAYMLEARGLLKLVILSVEDLAISSWWIILAAKLYMAVDVKREMMPNIFVMPFPFLYFS